MYQVFPPQPSPPPPWFYAVHRGSANWQSESNDKASTVKLLRYISVTFFRTLDLTIDVTENMTDQTSSYNGLCSSQGSNNGSLVVRPVNIQQVLV